MKKFIAAGTTLAFFGFVDSNGFLIGETTSAPANGSTQDMLRMLGIQNAAAGLPESEDVNIEGDDDVLGTITFPPNTTPAFIANFGAHDMTFNSRAQSTAIETLGGIDLSVLQPDDPSNPNGTFIVQGKSVDKDPGTSGQSAWSGFIFPLVTAQPLGRESFTGREAAVNRVKITAQKAAKKPWGVTILDADLGTTGASIIEFGSDYPLRLFRITGNGSTDSFTLPKALGATDHLFVWNETTQLSHGSGVTGTASSTTLAFDSAPAAGNRVIVLYGFVP